jgi:hypothetical protein
MAVQLATGNWSVSVLVSVRFRIPCVLLHFAALRLMAKLLEAWSFRSRCARICTRPFLKAEPFEKEARSGKLVVKTRVLKSSARADPFVVILPFDSPA